MKRTRIQRVDEFGCLVDNPSSSPHDVASSTFRITLGDEGLDLRHGRHRCILGAVYGDVRVLCKLVQVDERPTFAFCFKQNWRLLALHLVSTYNYGPGVLKLLRILFWQAFGPNPIGWLPPKAKVLDPPLWFTSFSAVTKYCEEMHAGKPKTFHRAADWFWTVRSNQIDQKILPYCLSNGCYFRNGRVAAKFEREYDASLPDNRIARWKKKRPKLSTESDPLSWL